MSRNRGRVVANDNGLIQTIYTDPQTGRTILHSKADEKSWGQIAELAKTVRNQVDENARWGEGDKVATIPAALQWDLMRQNIWPGPTNGYDKTLLKKWLNDPNNRAWRLRSGRI